MKKLWALGWQYSLIAVLCFSMILTGCTTAWISQAQSILAVLLPAAANIVALVAAFQNKSISGSDLTMIQSAGAEAGKDLTLIQGLIDQYQKADDAAKPNILNEIQSAITTVQGNWSGLLPALHIKDPALQAKIQAVVGLVLTEVQSLSVLVPLVHPNASPAMVRMATLQASKHPPLTASELVSAYNATMTAKTGDAAIDKATSRLTIHQHGKLARTITLGILK